MRSIQWSLSPNGLAIVTLEGRRSIEIQQKYYKIIADQGFKKIMASYRLLGFGYSSYDGDMKRLFNKHKSYGSAFVRPDWIMRQIMRLPDTSILGFADRAWDNHQDFVVFGRPGPVGLGH